MNIKQQYELLKQVFEHGKTLQISNVFGHWVDYGPDSVVNWDMSDKRFRIKPEPREWWACPQTISYVPANHPKPAEDWIRVREVLE